MRPLLYSIPFLILAACGKESSPPAKAAPEAPVQVSVASAARLSLPSTYEATGTVRARTSAVVSAKLMGYAKEVRAQVGDRVTEGQPLVVLDSRDLDTGVSRAESARELDFLFHGPNTLPSQHRTLLRHFHGTGRTADRGYEHSRPNNRRSHP